MKENKINKDIKLISSLSTCTHAHTYTHQIIESLMS